MSVCVFQRKKKTTTTEEEYCLPACLLALFSLSGLFFTAVRRRYLLKKEGEGKGRKVAAVHRSVQRTVIAIAAASGKRRMSKDADDKEEEDSGR